jgi:hypothetical protein
MYQACLYSSNAVRGGYAVVTPEGEWFDVGLYDTAYQLALNMKEICSEIKRLTH